MSVYANQTNASPGSSFFALAGSGGGGGTPSNWSSYPALTTITYSGEGGIANLTTVNALTAVSTLQLSAANLTVSSINAAVYPPAGGSASNWSQYPAINTITYTTGGGIANFSEVVADTSLSTPTVYATQVTTANISLETINGSAYPPAASGPIVGTLPIPADSTTVTSETIAGITGSSIITGTLTSSSACQIVSLQPGTNEFTIDVTPGAPSATRFNYAIYPAAT
jgi:hypothetical protein